MTVNDITVMAGYSPDSLPPVGSPPRTAPP